MLYTLVTTVVAGLCMGAGSFLCAAVGTYSVYHVTKRGEAR